MRDWIRLAQFYVVGSPIGMPRPRADARKKFVHIHYPDGEWQTWQTIIAITAKRHRPAEKLTGPIRFNADYFFERPKYMTKRKGYPDEPFEMIMKPDRDNLDKLTLDVFTKLDFWEDDCQVCAGHISKSYVGHGCNQERSLPGVLITIDYKEPLILTPANRKRVDAFKE